MKSIPLCDIKYYFLSNNNIPYDEAFDLMKKKYTSLEYMPNSIIEWMLAHNVVKNNINIPTYSVNDIESMSQNELNSLANKLGMNGNDIHNIIDILYYAGKLDNQFHMNKTLSYIKSSKDQNFLINLERELKHIPKNAPIHINVINFKVGDRITTEGRNYIISYIDDVRGTMKYVDLLGNVLDNWVINIILIYSPNDGIFWTIDDKYVHDKIVPGILLYEDGPIIRHMDDEIKHLYIKYDTILNMYVFVIHPDYDNLFHYRIKSFTTDKIILDSMSDFELKNFPQPKELIINKIGNVWEINDGWEIESIEIL